jgi:hypothetical protein
VIYVDFERTAAQFAERYSRRGSRGHRLSYRFSPNFQWSGIEAGHDVPEQYSRDVYAYYRAALCQLAAYGGVDVLIVDNLSELTRSLSGGGWGSRLMRIMKGIAAASRVSILALAPAKPGTRLRPASARDLAGGPAMADVADSVFAICPSTMAEDVRYLKHLKSRSAPVRLDERCVAAYRIGRIDDPPARAIALSDPDAAPPADARMLSYAAGALRVLEKIPKPAAAFSGSSISASRPNPNTSATTPPRRETPGASRQSR